jgi:hypothetical protein
MKICSTCKNSKSFDSFSKDKSRKDGLQCSCKTCKKIYTKKWNKDNKDFAAAKAKIRYNENKDIWAIKSKQRYEKNPNEHLNSKLKNKYGISLNEYNLMLEKQNYVCKICQHPETKCNQNGKIKRLCVDHCHITKHVRGLLCNGCNSAIGFLQENLTTMNNAIEYITENIIKTQF